MTSGAAVGRTTTRLDPRLVAELRRARWAHAVRRHVVAYLFLLPSLAFFLVFLAWPVIQVARQSLYEGGLLGPATYVGLDNWETALGSSEFGTSLRNTGLLTLMVIPLTFAFALGVALLLREVRRGGALLRAAVYFPALSPIVLAALVWIFMIHPDFGLLNVGNRALGLEPVNFRGDSAYALPMIASLDIWRAVGFWAIFLLAALLAVPRNLYHAAELDGASAWRRLLHVTLPGIRPQFAVAVLLATLAVLQTFDSVFVLTQGGPNGATETAVTYIYKSVFERSLPGVGAVLSIILVLVIMVITGVMARFLSSGRKV